MHKLIAWANDTLHKHGQHKLTKMLLTECRQCGKPFKPEKLHSHMKSCRGMKALAKTAAEKTQSHGSMASSQKESAYGYLLTN